MALIGSQITALATEINTDPTGLGYAQHTGDRLAIAALLNTVNAAIQIKRTDVMPSEVLEAIDIRDLAYPGSGQVAAANQPLVNSYIESLTQLSKLRLEKDDGTDTTILKNLKLILVAAGQGSQTRIIALSTRSGSRAEQLFGSGVVITDQDVANAVG